MSGYIKLHRKIQVHPLWLLERFSKGQAWIDLLLSANHRDGKVLRGGHWIEIKRGQVFTSQNELARKWKWDRKTVKSFLLTLKTDSMLDIQTDKGTDTGYTLLTINNYSHFQGSDSDTLDIQTDIVSPTLVSKSPHPNGRPSGHSNGHPNLLDLKQLAEDGNSTMGDANGHPVPHSLPTNKNEKKYKNKKPSVFWSDFLRQFTAEDQELLSDVLSAISSTRKRGKITEGVQDEIATNLSASPHPAVLAGCRTYLEKGCAAEGKDERYLFGIVRRFSQNGTPKVITGPQSQAKTPGQLAIEAAMRELTEARI